MPLTLIEFGVTKCRHDWALWPWDYWNVFDKDNESFLASVVLFSGDPALWPQPSIAEVLYKHYPQIQYRMQTLKKKKAHPLAVLWNSYHTKSFLNIWSLFETFWIITVCMCVCRQRPIKRFLLPSFSLLCPETATFSPAGFPRACIDFPLALV